MEIVRKRSVFSPRIVPNESETEKSVLSADVSRTSAVIVQQTTVSKNTSNALHIPCSAGESFSEEQWRIGELPNPASFEKMPRLMPAETALDTANPDIPPAADVKLKASVNIFSIADGILLRNLKITRKDIIKYVIVIAGRSA